MARRGERDVISARKAEAEQRLILQNFKETRDRVGAEDATDSPRRSRARGDLAGHCPRLVTRLAGHFPGWSLGRVVICPAGHSLSRWSLSNRSLSRWVTGPCPRRSRPDGRRSPLAPSQPRRGKSTYRAGGLGSLRAPGEGKRGGTGRDEPGESSGRQRRELGGE